MFKLKKWLWQRYMLLIGAERAYAKYLAHFYHYQQHVADSALQQDLNLAPMTKQAFLAAWQTKRTKPSCKPGCCG
ncbi:MAG: hypothetical protein B7X98_00345 [Methylophilaceae bacterium 17-43-7]|jgi:hypothetical protein|nr:MAG: hypothetical protein B7Y48_10820 [Methylophilales bacterium 28-44-11]OYZ06043.1 MAG: hypothetical protein B7Y32_03345 [Methylophilales bacterium 16-45-7]OYZ71005.1 MAG: hypothetical protein B7X98_00345 [Methylophilaceae bacterium 17-43-7]